MTNANPERRSYAKGSLIFSEGNKGAEAYLVQKGAVRIFKHVEDKTVTLGICNPWQVFGELALMDDRPRMASAEAAEDTEVLVVSKDAIRDMLDTASPSLTTLIHSLIGTMRAMGEELAATRARLMELEG